ncbi:MAG: class I SAM-dependent methyltransferase [Candidatus Limnocylindrales bacterium]
MSDPRMYSQLASWFHLITAPADYADEAADVVRLLATSGVTLGPEHADATVLELGSGGGNTASHLKAGARLTLTDIAPAMLALSATLNPECEHIAGDMRTLRLGRTFDAVLLHDAVTYMTTEADLRAAMETAFVHLRPGGAAVLLPDFTAETFRAETRHGGHDGSDGRSLRYLEWTSDPDPADTTVVTDYAYLLREADGSMRALGDRHVLGVFPRGTWLRLLADVGFSAHQSVGVSGRDVFVGVHP